MILRKDAEIAQLQAELQNKPKSNAAILLDLEKKLIQLKNELQQQHINNQDLKDQNERISEENHNLTELVAILKQEDESSSNVNSLNQMKIDKIQKIAEDQQLQLESKVELIHHQDQDLETL